MKYNNKRTKKRSIEDYQLSNMLRQVILADVVITSFTKYAIAVRYDEIKNDAPSVTAKGMDEVALKMIKIATKNAILINQNAILAKSLYQHVENINTQIPEALYTDVAQIMALVYQNGKKT